MGMKTRGLKLQAGKASSPGKEPAASEFFQTKQTVKTKK
jgi:hypothetical protein